MKNVIKIALLSTVAMVGTAHAETNADAVQIAQNAVDKVYEMAGITTGSHNDVDTAFQAVIDKIDQVYGLEESIYKIVGYNYATFTPKYDTVNVNTDTPDENTEFTTEISNLTNEIKKDIWGDVLGATAYSGLEGLNTISSANSGTLNTYAGTLYSNINSLNTAVDNFNADKSIGVSAIQSASALITGETGSAAVFKNAADSVNSATTEITNNGFDHESIGQLDSLVAGHTLTN